MSLHLDWPQIIYLALVLLGFSLTVAKHGTPRTPHNAFIHLSAIAISFTLLYFGGFWAAGAP